MGKFENVIRIILTVFATIALLDIVTSIQAILNGLRKRIKLTNLKIANETEISLATYAWSNTIEKIKIICDSYTSDKRYQDMDKTVMFDNARTTVMKSIDSDDLAILKKIINPDIEYMISLLVASALDKDRFMPPAFSPDMMPYDWFYNQFDDDDEDDEDDDED